MHVELITDLRAWDKNVPDSFYEILFQHLLIELINSTKR